ncbi:hypothetical protein CPB86DRAFT_498553 [Serendipita vermifera]|nr:hypothetical protein CPB86DRAFT_498553 [Serendipita vermifera]
MYVNALGRDTEDFPDMLAEVEEYYSLQHAGVDRWDPSVTCLFTEDDFQNVKANVRLPLLDRKEGDPRWDAYFKDGLSSLGAEEREAVELYRDVILKEGDLAVYELDTNGEKEETPSTTADELLAFAQSVSEKFTEHVSVCPFLEDPATAFSELVSAELERDEKDRRIAIVFTFLSELLVLLTKCTSEHESELEPMLEGIHAQINLSRDIFDTFYIQPWFVRTWQLPQWEDRFLEMIDAFEEHKTELHKILKIDGSEPSKVSKLAVHLRTIEERRLDARIDYRGGRDTVLSKFNDIFEITQPHTGGDYDQHLALYFRVVAPIDDWISHDARINRYPLDPEACNPPAMTETEEKLRDFQKARTKEDLIFYQSVAKMEFRKLPWHK